MRAPLRRSLACRSLGVGGGEGEGGAEETGATGLLCSDCCLLWVPNRLDKTIKPKKTAMAAVTYPVLSEARLTLTAALLLPALAGRGAVCCPQ